MTIRETFTNLLKTWAFKKLTPTNVHAILTIGLVRLRELADNTETKVDDWILNFLESIAFDETKIKTFTDFIRSKLAGVYGDGPVNDEYQNLAATLSADGTYCTSLERIIQLGKFLADFVPLIIDFFREKKA